MGITPFFVENVSELQLCAIKLVTAVSNFLFAVSCPWTSWQLLGHLHHLYFCWYRSRASK